MSLSTVLLTGAAGFIGSHLAEVLVDRGYRVIGVDNFFRGKLSNLNAIIDNPCFNLVECDLASYGAREFIHSLCKQYGVTDVIHLAAINGTQYFYDRPWSVLDVNINATRELMYAIRETSVQHITYASSSEVYGDPIKIPTPESAPILLNSSADRDSYASSKALGEFQVRLNSQLSGIQYLIVRIFNMYGPRLVSSNYGQVVAEFVKRALREDVFTIIGNGLTTRSFCYVGDGADAIADLLKSRATGCINLGNNDEITILDLAKLIHRKLDKPFQPVFLPARAHDHRRRCPDLQCLHQHLPQFKPRTLDEGLHSTIQWFREGRDLSG